MITQTNEQIVDAFCPHRTPEHAVPDMHQRRTGLARPTVENAAYLDEHEADKPGVRHGDYMLHWVRSEWLIFRRSDSARCVRRTTGTIDDAKRAADIYDYNQKVLDLFHSVPWSAWDTLHTEFVTDPGATDRYRQMSDWYYAHETGIEPHYIAQTTALSEQVWVLASTNVDPAIRYFWDKEISGYDRNGIDLSRRMMQVDRTRIHSEQECLETPVGGVIMSGGLEFRRVK